MFQKLKYYLNTYPLEFWCTILLLIMAYFPLFWKLNSLALQKWDEARNVWNAYEMYKNNNFLVSFFDGKPDMWNTKPTLFIGIQAIFMHIFGANILSARLPSAIAGFFTLIVVFVFCIKYLKNYFIAFFSVLILISCEGIIRIHGTRTGDFDAILTLFSTLYVLYFYLYIQTPKNKYLFLSTIFIIMATLTKGIAGLFFIFPMFIFLVYTKNIFSIIKNKAFYFSILFFVFFVFGYYFLREYYNNGYIHAVFENELGGRFIETNEGHYENFWYYINNFETTYYKKYFIFFIIGIILAFFEKDLKLKKFLQYILVCIFSFLLIISIAATKIQWYDIPIYPFVAIVTANCLVLFYKIILNNTQTFINYSKYFSHTILFIFALFIYKNNLVEIHNKIKYESDNWDNCMAAYLKNMYKKNNLNTSEIYVLMTNKTNYLANEKWYAKCLQEKYNLQTFFITDITEIKENSMVLLKSEDWKNNPITNYYNVDTLAKSGYIISYKIKNKIH